MKSVKPDSHQVAELDLPKGATIVAYSDVFGEAPTSADLRTHLAQFKSSHLLIVYAQLSVLVRAWSNTYDGARQDAMADLLLPFSAGKVKDTRRRFSYGLVFTRLGLLCFLRQVLAHTTEDGREVTEPADWEKLGMALLMCNDLYLGYEPSSDDSILQRAAGFLPAHELLPGEGYF